MPRPSMREEIIEAALDQFHANGFNAAGVKDITDAAGAPKGSFYNHFDSKQDLAIVALQRYGATRRLAELADTTVPPLQRLREHFEFLRQENAERDFTRGCLIGNFGIEIGDHSPTIRTAVNTALHNWGEILAEVIAQGQHEGAIRSSLDPATTAQFVLSAWEGSLIAARVDRSGQAFDVFFEVVFGALLA